MKFKVGDIVITKKCVRHGTGPKGPAGVECTIRSIDSTDEYGLVYETDIPCNLPGFSPAYPYWWGCEGCFDLKPPPVKEQIGEWGLCPWQPSPTITASGTVYWSGLDCLRKFQDQTTGYDK